MNFSWKNLEDHVRNLAELRWKKPCVAEHINGVDFDGVIRVDADEIILLAITKERNLEKVRNDISKIQSVKLKYAGDGIVCKGFIILEENPTSYMREVGVQNKIKVCSVKEFASEFYSFEAYNNTRINYPFGSAVDSETGNNDKRQYIEVKYQDIDSHKSFNYQKIARELIDGKNIVLIGDYGTGKSRCVREIYKFLSAEIKTASAYPLAINLKDHWSSANAVGIIAEHLGNLGLTTSIDNTIQLLNSGNLILLLDGFDEIGTQVHDSRIEDRKSIRKKAVSGVRDLISKSKRGVLITGRSHFFDSNEEMIDSLGLANRQDNTLVLAVPDSFSSDEAQKYLIALGVQTSIPNWLPKKPLIFQILIELSNLNLSDILNHKDFTEYKFWTSFILAVCKRESLGVKETISATTISHILHTLAEKTRFSKEFLGRLSPSDIDLVYASVVGSVPDENGRQLLSRMCMLGRIDPSSPDRQFVDVSILDILRASSFINDINNMKDPGNLQWKHSLRTLGLLHAANMIMDNDLIQQCFIYIKKFSDTKNTYCLGELISILSIINKDDIDIETLVLNHSYVPILNLAENKTISNLTIQNTEIGTLLLNNTSITDKNHLMIKDCIISTVSGISDQKGFPSWIQECDTISFDVINNATRIKESTLRASQKLFLSIIQKIFFQSGVGRDEKTLKRGGYGQQYDAKLIDSILKILIREGMIEKDERNGVLYRPVRKHTMRMEKIRAELTLSDDPIWKMISEL